MIGNILVVVGETCENIVYVNLSCNIVQRTKRIDKSKGSALFVSTLFKSSFSVDKENYRTPVPVGSAGTCQNKKCGGRSPFSVLVISPWENLVHSNKSFSKKILICSITS